MLVSPSVGAVELCRAMGVPNPEGVRVAVLRVAVDEIATMTIERFADDADVQSLPERYGVTERLVSRGETVASVCEAAAEAV